ncbi:MAG: PilZ domain-containing protein [Syntrophales bacterium]|nr:PilZ domain-containing protein [Syntrophales bacterium]MDY0044273.1 PilZ domain-containing protein [Syntrophales bacterium]
MKKKIAEGSQIDLSFGYGDTRITAKGLLKSLTAEGGMIIDVDIRDKRVTLTHGTDIYIKGMGLFNIIDSSHFPTIGIEEVHKRSHARVDDILKVTYQHVPHEMYLKGKGNPRIILENIFGECPCTPEDEEISMALLYKLVYQLTVKIDRILDVLERTGDTQVHETAYGESVNISASGMRFETANKIRTGDILALRVFMPSTAATRLHVLGEVVAVTPYGNEDRSVVSIKFINLSQEMQETITRYVFKRQRELLRLEKKP